MKKILFILFQCFCCFGIFAQENFKILLDYQFNYAENFSEGLAVVSKNGLYGFIDKNGNPIINYQYEFAKSFSEGLAPVVKNNKYGFINKSGKVVINYQYKDADVFSEGLAAVSKEGFYIGRCGFIDKNGNTVLDYNYAYPSKFSEGLARVSGVEKLNDIYVSDNNYKCIDKRGNVIINRNIYINEFSEGLAPYKQFNNWGYINKFGETIIGSKYYLAREFSEGLAAVTIENGGWGYINKEGSLIIDYQYEDADVFSEGLAAVKKNGLWGYIDKKNNVIIDFQFEFARSFSEGLALIGKNETDKPKKSALLDLMMDKYGFIKYLTLEEQIQEYVVNKLNAWINKGEFEKTVDYEKRVTEESKNKKITDLTNEAISLLKKKETKNINSKTLSLGDYDADNESFIISSGKYGDIVIHVPLSEASLVKNNWNKMKFSNIDFYIASNQFLLSKLNIINPANNSVYKYDSKIQTNYLSNNIKFSIDNINIKIPESANAKPKEDLFTPPVLTIKDSIDKFIPTNSIKNTNTFALIIGNEDYKKEIKVPYAINDAKIFTEYCTKTLGIPQKQIHTLINGTYGEILGEIKWLTEVIDALNGEANIIVYYAGHGIPDPKEKTAYILPVDGISSVPQTAIVLDNLYKQLSEKPAKKVVVFLDACFSGASRDGMLSQGRGVRIAPKTNVLSGNMIVFSATSNDEIALPFKEKQHGLFTYYLLDKLNKTKGNVTLEELYNYIYQNVKKQSVLVNQNSQNPNLIFSPDLNEEWKMMKLF